MLLLDCLQLDLWFVLLSFFIFIIFKTRGFYGKIPRRWPLHEKVPHS